MNIPFIGMLEKKVVKFLIKRLFGEYLSHEVRIEDLEVRLFSGLFSLSDLRLNVACVNEKLETLPFLLTRGTLGKLSVSVPFTALIQQPIQIIVEDSVLCFRLKSADDMWGTQSVHQSSFRKHPLAQNEDILVRSILLGDVRKDELLNDVFSDDDEGYDDGRGGRGGRGGGAFESDRMKAYERPTGYGGDFASSPTSSSRGSAHSTDDVSVIGSLLDRLLSNVTIEFRKLHIELEYSHDEESSASSSVVLTMESFSVRSTEDFKYSQKLSEMRESEPKSWVEGVLKKVVCIEGVSVVFESRSEREFSFSSDEEEAAEEKHDVSDADVDAPSSLHGATVVPGNFSGHSHEFVRISSRDPLLCMFSVNTDKSPSEISIVTSLPHILLSFTDRTFACLHRFLSALNDASLLVSSVVSKDDAIGYGVVRPLSDVLLRSALMNSKSAEHVGEPQSPDSDEFYECSDDPVTHQGQVVADTDSASFFPKFTFALSLRSLDVRYQVLDSDASSITFSLSSTTIQGSYSKEQEAIVTTVVVQAGSVQCVQEWVTAGREERVISIPGSFRIAHTSNGSSTSVVVSADVLLLVLDPWSVQVLSRFLKNALAASSGSSVDASPSRDPPADAFSVTVSFRCVDAYLSVKEESRTWFRDTFAFKSVVFRSMDFEMNVSSKEIRCVSSEYSVHIVTESMDAVLDPDVVPRFRTKHPNPCAWSPEALTITVPFKDLSKQNIVDEHFRTTADTQAWLGGVADPLREFPDSNFMSVDIQISRMHCYFSNRTFHGLVCILNRVVDGLSAVPSASASPSGTAISLSFQSIQFSLLPPHANSIIFVATSLKTLILSNTSLTDVFLSVGSLSFLRSNTLDNAEMAFLRSQATTPASAGSIFLLRSSHRIASLPKSSIVGFGHIRVCFDPLWSVNKTSVLFRFRSLALDYSNQSGKWTWIFDIFNFVSLSPADSYPDPALIAFPRRSSPSLTDVDVSFANSCINVIPERSQSDGMTVILLESLALHTAVSPSSDSQIVIDVSRATFYLHPLFLSDVLLMRRQRTHLRADENPSFNDYLRRLDFCPCLAIEHVRLTLVYPKPPYSKENVETQVLCSGGKMSLSTCRDSFAVFVHTVSVLVASLSADESTTVSGASVPGGDGTSSAEPMTIPDSVPSSQASRSSSIVDVSQELDTTPSAFSIRFSADKSESDILNALSANFFSPSSSTKRLDHRVSFFEDHVSRSAGRFSSRKNRRPIGVAESTRVSDGDDLYLFDLVQEQGSGDGFLRPGSKWQIVSDYVSSSAKDPQAHVQAMLKPFSLPPHTSIMFEDVSLSWSLFGGNDFGGELAFRNTSRMLEVVIDGLELYLFVFPSESNVQTHLHCSIRNVEIFDRIQTSERNKLLYCWNKGGRTRESGTSFARISWDSALHNALTFHILPVRLNIDQDAVDFFLEFFVHYESDIVVVGSRPDDTITYQPIFFASVQMLTDTAVKIDYAPKRVDYVKLKEGGYLELLNFFPLKGVELSFRALCARGCSGIAEVIEQFANVWIPDIRRSQLHKCIGGVPPFRTVYRVGSGFADLFIIPFEQFKKDRRLMRGISKGVSSFAKNLTSEAFGVASQAASGLQTLLAAFSGRVSHDGAHRTAHSVSEGLSLAADDLRGGIENAYRAVVFVPFQDGSSVLRAVPIAFVSPLTGVAGAVSKAAEGIKNALDPEDEDDHEQLYKSV
eukprot:ANDGO_06046.mRNA.1 Autophagy-related protein 2